MSYPIDEEDFNASKQITVDELKAVLTSVTELTELRMKETPHLSVENFAPELLGKLLLKLSENKRGIVS